MKRIIQSLGVFFVLSGLLIGVGAFMFALSFAVIPVLVEKAGEGDGVALWLLVIGGSVLLGIIGGSMIACTEEPSTGEEQ